MWAFLYLYCFAGLFTHNLMESLKLHSRQPLTVEKEAVSVTFDTEFTFTRLLVQEDFFVSLLF